MSTLLLLDWSHLIGYNAIVNVARKWKIILRQSFYQKILRNAALILVFKLECVLLMVFLPQEEPRKLPWWHLFRCRTHVGVPAWRCGDRNADGHTLLHATVHGQHELALSPLRLASSVLVSPPIRREPAAACRRELVGGGNGTHDAGHARHAGRDGYFLTRHTGLFYCAAFHRVSTDRSSFGWMGDA